MRNRLGFWLVTCMALPALVACGSSTGGGGNSNGGGGTGGGDLGPSQTVSADEAVTVANENVGVFADDVSKKIAFLTDSKTLDGFGGDCAQATDGSGGSGGAPVDGQPVDDCGEDFDADQAAKDVKEWFQNNLFKIDLKSVELSTDKMVVFCLKPEDACKNDSDAPSVPGGSGGGEPIDGKKPAPSIDEDCAAGLKAVPVCLAVTRHGAKDLKGQLLVGIKPQVVPATFTLTPDKFSGEVDLAKAREAVDMVTKAMKEDAGEMFPSKAMGLVGFDLLRNADKTITGAVHVKQAVEVGAFDKSDKRFYNVKAAQANDVLKLILGKADRSVLVAVGAGQLDIGVALDLMMGESDCEGGSGSTGNPPTPDPGKSDDPDDGCGVKKDYTGALFASLAAVGFQVDFTVDSDKSKDSFGIKGLTLGGKPVTVNFDDGKVVTEIATLELNKNAKPVGVLDFSAIYDGDKATLTTLPSLEVTAGHALAALAKQVEDIPKFALKGFTAISLNGADKPTVEIKGGGEGDKPTSKPAPIPDPGGGSGDPLPPPDGETEGGSDFPDVKVLAGLLTLKAWNMEGIADVTVEVKQGQCMVEKKSTGDNKDEGHLFSNMEAGVCK